MPNWGRGCSGRVKWTSQERIKCTKAKDQLRSHYPNLYTVDTGKFFGCGSSCRCSYSNQMGKLCISRDDFQNLNRVQWYASVSVPAELSNGHYWFLPVLWHVLVMVGLMVSKTLETNALLFYRFQNVLCWSKFFEPAKNLTAFSASSKTFVPAQKPILLNANHLFVRHKMFVTGTKCSQLFGLAQKNWTGTKHFGTCKRTRHYLSLLSLGGEAEHLSFCLRFLIHG